LALCNRCAARVPAEIRARVAAATSRAERIDALGAAVRALSEAGQVREKNGG
jgi:hypothetical protein